VLATGAGGGVDDTPPDCAAEPLDDAGVGVADGAVAVLVVLVVGVVLVVVAVGPAAV
jgi:hypothetical protein